MVKRCTEEDENALMDYLKQEVVYHTFLLADIQNFGFDQDFQTVYADYADDKIKGVYLQFYGNLIVSAEENNVQEKFLQDLFSRWQPDVIMGKASLIEKIGKLLPDYILTEKGLYLMEEGNLLPQSILEEKKGKPGDEDKIHSFLMEIPEIRALYTSKKMIADRLNNGDGIHLYLEKDGDVIAHVNSAAQSPYTVMIGGVAVSLKERGHDFAAILTGSLCREILQRGKMPCLFCDRGEEHNLFVDIGFHKVGMWGTLTARPKVLPSENRLPSYIPVYNQLYQDLVDGVYEKDSLLPSENVLAAAYKVSRNTLRQALTILCQDGYIYKHQGKGTFVSFDCHKVARKNLYNFLKECAKEPVVRITMDHNLGLPTSIAKRKLELKEGEEVLASNNVYWDDEKPIGQSFLQIPKKILEQYGITAEELDEDRLLSFFDEGLYRKAQKAHMTIQVVLADEQVISYMKIPEGTMLLHIEQLLYGADNSPLARVKYYFIPDKYQVDCQIQA